MGTWPVDLLEIDTRADWETRPGRPDGLGEPRRRALQLRLSTWSSRHSQAGLPDLFYSTAYPEPRQSQSYSLSALLDGGQIGPWPSRVTRTVGETIPSHADRFLQPIIS